MASETERDPRPRTWGARGRDGAAGTGSGVSSPACGLWAARGVTGGTGALLGRRCQGSRGPREEQQLGEGFGPGTPRLRLRGAWRTITGGGSFLPNDSFTGQIRPFIARVSMTFSLFAEDISTPPEGSSCPSQPLVRCHSPWICLFWTRRVHAVTEHVASCAWLPRPRTPHSSLRPRPPHRVGHSTSRHRERHCHGHLLDTHLTSLGDPGVGGSVFTLEGYGQGSDMT